jgi:hypothetical protein
VKIQAWALNPADPPQTVSALPDGYDLYTTFTFVDTDGHDDVFFDEIRCSGKYYSDIYEIPAAETP